MTRKEFTDRCKGIKATASLTREEKEKEIRHIATMFTDFNLLRKTPEIRDLDRRYKETEKRLAGYNGFSYCPESGDWYPTRPPEIQALDREYEELSKWKAFETFRKAWAGKAA